MKISISMIALNEEHFIARALSSCRFADEVVVVDGGSTDKTIEILRGDPKVKIVQHPWEDHFGRQRQVSLQHCSGDWIIRLDADEAFSLAFEQEIRAILEQAPEGVEACRVKQCNLVGNEHYYSKGADKFETIPRIWRNRSTVRWELSIHETLKGINGTVLDLDLYVVHYGFLNKSIYLKKGERYSQIEGSQVNRAEDLVFRNYDFQPVPIRAKVGSHVIPYTMPDRRSDKPRVAIVRGPHLNPKEIQLYRPLQHTFDLTVYTSCEPPQDWPQTDIPTIRLPKDNKVHTAMNGLEYALFDTDIVFTSEIVWPYSYQAIKTKEKFGKKIVALQSETRPFAWEDNKTIEYFKKSNRTMVDVFVADNVCARDALLIEGVPQEKTVVIPMGVNMNEWSPDTLVRARARKQLRISESEIIVLYTGNLEHEGGISDLLHAVKLIQIHGNPAPNKIKCLIVGKEGEPEALAKSIEMLGLNDTFVFCAGLTLHELFNAADIFYLRQLPEGSWKEPSPMILRKAMTFGLPVIATATESIPDIAGDAAVLIPHGNPGALCAAIKELKNENHREALSREAKQRAKEQFSAEKTARDLTKLFQMVLQSDQSDRNYL